MTNIHYIFLLPNTNCWKATSHYFARIPTQLIICNESRIIDTTNTTIKGSILSQVASLGRPLKDSPVYFTERNSQADGALNLLFRWKEGTGSSPQLIASCNGNTLPIE